MGLGFVVGLAAEARIAARFGHQVETGGGTSAGAAVAACRLIDAGATALISFGLAGGLDPELRPGAVIVPQAVLLDGVTAHVDAPLAGRFGGLTAHTLLAGRCIVANAAAKRDLHLTTGAHAVDLESGAVAAAAKAHGLPFIVIRAICDPAERNLPAAALTAVGPEGSIAIGGVLRSVLGNPRQIFGLLALAHDAKLARAALLAFGERFRAERVPE